MSKTFNPSIPFTTSIDAPGLSGKSGISKILAVKYRDTFDTSYPVFRVIPDYERTKVTGPLLNRFLRGEQKVIDKELLLQVGGELSKLGVIAEGKVTELIDFTHSYTCDHFGDLPEEDVLPALYTSLIYALNRREHLILSPAGAQLIFERWLGSNASNFDRLTHQLQLEDKIPYLEKFVTWISIVEHDHLKTPVLDSTILLTAREEKIRERLEKRNLANTQGANDIALDVLEKGTQHIVDLQNLYVEFYKIYGPLRGTIFRVIDTSDISLEETAEVVETQLLEWHGR